MLDNIPFELRQLRQWVCASENKIPINPNTGRVADCNDPSSWGTFDEAASAGYKHIGFVLTKNDPYCVIDLDFKLYAIPSPEESAVHSRILDNFDTYTERSANGLGFHIVTKASIPKGRRRGSVEVYSDQRYIIFTGNVVKNQPINNCQEYIDLLIKEMPDTGNLQDLTEVEESISDNKLMEYASNAVNGEKFDKLCSGIWQEDYPSQSEADFALMAIIAFYTESNAQVRRIFRHTMLGKREKAQRDDYLNYAIAKVRSVLGRRVDLEAAKTDLESFKPSIPAPPQNINIPNPPIPLPPNKKQAEAITGELESWDSLQYPPGFIGDIARYFFATSIRPVKEISILSAIALIAGITGRYFNISGSGLNQYLIILAKTGSGKEGAAKAIEQLVNAVRYQVPSIDNFIGPAAFSSGQALIRSLEKSPCFVSVLGEFGLTLQQISSRLASSNEKMFKKVLLDIYGKSGKYSNLRSSVYSDAEKNTKIISSPNMTLLGESNPDSFFESLEQYHIAEGLIPRFSIIEYKGPRPERNKNCNIPPDVNLVNRFTSLVSICISLESKSNSVPVQIELKANDLLDNFDAECDSYINNSQSDIEMQLWNRAHLKTLKLSALIAVANNPIQPTINEEFAKWAIYFVKRDVDTILSRFKEGSIGLGESKQEYDLKRIIKNYPTLDNETIETYKINPLMWKKGVIPLSYLSRRCLGISSFKIDRMGARRALQECIKSFLEQGVLVEVPTNQLQEEFNARSKCYVIGKEFN